MKRGKTARIIGFLVGGILLLSAIAHAMAWPQLAAALAAAGAAELAGPLAIGWYFGSVAMAVFGLVVLTIAGRRADPAPVRWIAVGYLVFGLVAFFTRDLNPHFLLFVVTGLLLGLFALLAREAER